MPGNSLGNNRKNASGSHEKFGVKCIWFRESGNGGESGIDVEATGTARRGGVWAVVWLLRYVIRQLFGFAIPVGHRTLSPSLFLLVVFWI